MYYEILFAHKIFVWIFLLIYFIKASLLFSGKKDLLARFTRIFKVPDMAVSTLFLVTGIYLWTQTGNTGIWLYVKVAMVAASIPLAVIGFKKSNAVLVISSILLLLVAYRFSETKNLSFKKKSFESAAGMDAKSPDYGKYIYESNCVNCHGVDGKLGLSGSTDLSASQMDVTGKAEVVASGRRAMPAFSKVLSHEQVEAVASYLETLKK